MKLVSGKRILGIILSLIMVLSLAACGGKKEPAPEAAATEEEKPKEEVAAPEEEKPEEAASTEQKTLRLYGPGLFTTVGPDGTMDLITGVEKPGYNVVIDRWKELHPDVDVQIDAVPWDNWKAAVQTAALSGDYDILIHGNGNADFCLDMTDYIANDAEVSADLTFYPYRRNPDNMTEVRPYGFSYSLNPQIAIIDKEILANYGVDIPDADWTFEDILSIAKATTGTNPVTSKQTYGVSMYPISEAYKTYKVITKGFDNVIFDFAPALKDTKVTFDNPKTEEVFDYIAELGKYSSPDYLEGLNLNSAYTAENETAIIWADDAFNKFNTIEAAGLADRFMFLPFPKTTEGEHAGITSSALQDLNISIYKDTEQKDLAWEFIKFLVTDPEIQQWFMDTYTVSANSKYTSILSDVMPAEYLDSVSEVIQTSPPEYDSSASVWYDSTWFGTLQSDLGNELDLLIKGDTTSAEATQRIQANIDSYMQALE